MVSNLAIYYFFSLKWLFILDIDSSFEIQQYYHFFYALRRDLQVLVESINKEK